MWKTIKNFFSAIKQFNFKTFYSKKEILTVNQAKALLAIKISSSAK